MSSPTKWVDQTNGDPNTEWDDGDTEWDLDGNVAETLWDAEDVSTTWTEVA